MAGGFGQLSGLCLTLSRSLHFLMRCFLEMRLQVH